MNKKEYTEWDAFCDAFRDDPKFRFTAIGIGLLTLISSAGLILEIKAAVEESNSDIPEGVTITKF